MPCLALPSCQRGLWQSAELGREIDRYAGVDGAMSSEQALRAGSDEPAFEAATG